MIEVGCTGQSGYPGPSEALCLSSVGDKLATRSYFFFIADIYCIFVHFKYVLISCMRFKAEKKYMS